MQSSDGWRDRRTGRVFGFRSETQRENFMVARARFSNGPNRQMPRCTAVNKLGEPCRATRPVHASPRGPDPHPGCLV